MRQKNLSTISSIQQIQHDFISGVFNQDYDCISKHIRQSNIDAKFRLKIYRNNIFQCLRHALEMTFPNVWKLVGKECADTIAYRFCQNLNNLPLTPCLDDWGNRFPAFLQKIEPIHRLVYLKDIAELEWLQHKSNLAANFKALTPSRLQRFSHHLETLRFKFNPSVHLFSSGYLLKEIINFIDQPDDKIKINLQRQPCYAVIARKSNHVFIQWISRDQFHFFSTIKNGFTLIQSYEAICSKNSDFDLNLALQLMFKFELLWKLK